MGFQIDGDIIKLLIASTYAMGVIAVGNKGPWHKPTIIPSTYLRDWSDCIGLPSNLLEIVNIIFVLIF